MARWIKKPSETTKTRYYHQFVFKNCRYRGFSFDCDKDGNVPEKNQDGFRECREDKSLLYEGLKKDSWIAYDLGTIECICGATLELYSYWTNECLKCGELYDDSGGLLAPREFWGEETGEIF